MWTEFVWCVVLSLVTRVFHRALRFSSLHKNQHVSRVLCAKIENVVVVSVSEKQAHISESCQYNQPAQTNKRLLLLLLLLLLLWKGIEGQACDRGRDVESLWGDVIKRISHHIRQNRRTFIVYELINDPRDLLCCARSSNIRLRFTKKIAEIASVLLPFSLLYT